MQRVASPAPAARPVFRTLPPLSLYVHLPWCLRKCPYCDFNSHALRGELPEAAYLAALVADLEAALPQVWGRRVGSVFFGGGTPSLFSPTGIERLLADIRARLPLLPEAEVTLEANPGTFERERFRAYRGAGVTRLSIGVQSFDDRALRAIGRVHDAAQARAAVEEAALAFETFNLDLMYALPGQDLAALEAELEAALAFAPPHLSIYHLSLEPNTLFATRPPPDLPGDDLASEMLDLIVERAAAAGLVRYEVSAFARAGHRCAHNLNYWRFGDYLGIGAGAHGKVSMPGRVVREVRCKQPKQYVERALAGDAVMERREVEPGELGFEFMLNALRLTEGVPAALFAERTGVPIASIAREIGVAARRGLLDPDPALLRATPLGRRFLNELVALFLRERAEATDAR